MASKMLLPADEEMQLMDTRIASRAIATIQVISLMAIIIVHCCPVKDRTKSAG
jgi:hypothetical protein